VASTFALILLGGIVRVSDSGLGCGPAGSGLNGWPLCNGDVLPGLDLNVVIEYAHRALASVVGLLFLALAAMVWRRYRHYRGMRRAALAAAVLVIFQGLLGALTVEYNLEPLLVALHLGMAMLLLGLVYYLWRAATRADGEPPRRGSNRLWRLGVATSAAIFLTIVAGGYMAGTENRGRVDQAESTGAHYACGREFPTCNGDVLPFGAGQLVDIHLAHRSFMYLASLLVTLFTVAVLRRRLGGRSSALAHAAGGLLVLQILLGALNVWLPEQIEMLILAHLGVATLLWGSLVALLLELRPPAAPWTAAAQGDTRARAGTPALAGS